MDLWLSLGDSGDSGEDLLDLSLGNTNNGLSWPKVKKSKPKASWSCGDGIVGALEDNNRYLITSPNSDYIPELPYGFDSIRVRADAKFGIHDPIQWPQIFCPTHKWLACILRNPQRESDPRSIIWQTPTTLDFDVTYSTLDHAWGVLSKNFRTRLETHVDSLASECSIQMADRGHLAILYTHCHHMKEAFHRLKLPATFRDMVRQVAATQRYYLYTRAILDWNLHIAARRAEQGPHLFMGEYIGAFTTDPKVASMLYFIGVRMWYLRLPQQVDPDTAVKKLVEPVLSSATLCNDDGEFGHIIHFRNMGLNYIDAIARFGDAYLDIDRGVYNTASHTFTPSLPMPLPAPAIPRSTTQSSSSGSRSSHPKQDPKHRVSPYKDTRKQSKKGTWKNPQDQGRDKRSEPWEEWVPEECPAWAEAVRMVSLEEGITVQEPWLWHVPEPGLVFNADNPFRRNTYIRRWVSMRLPLVHALQHPTLITRLPGLGAQHWRTALWLGPKPSLTNAKDSRHNKAITHVRDYFRPLIPSDFSNDSCPSFFDHTVPDSDDVPLGLCSKIAWELYELGFRQGLQRLDHHLVHTGEGSGEMYRRELLSQVYPDGGVFVIAHLPNAHVGLAAPELSDRAPSLDALRRIFKRWPDVPESIQGMLPLRADSDESYLMEAERTLAQYYCQIYRKVSGRVPIVPRKFPLE